MRGFVLVGWLLATTAIFPACADQPPLPQAAAIIGDITFFYYDDLPRAAAFYETLLGLPPEESPSWVRLFPLTKTVTLGLVNATGGTLRPAPNKPVLLTLLVDGIPAVDWWYARVQAQGIPVTEQRKTTRLDDNRSIYAFIFKDPEGYAIEILTWIPGAQR